LNSGPQRFTLSRQVLYYLSPSISPDSFLECQKKKNALSTSRKAALNTGTGNGQFCWVGFSPLHIEGNRKDPIHPCSRTESIHTTKP
jgi:hypothetical protein